VGVKSLSEQNVTLLQRTESLNLGFSFFQNLRLNVKVSLSGAGNVLITAVALVTLVPYGKVVNITHWLKAKLTC
jgi:hypothetical protein